MPLIKKKSQKAFEHNLKAEMHSGKPQDQALAIAYDVKRRSKHAKGGKVKSRVNEAGNYTKPGMRKSLFEKIKGQSVQGVFTHTRKDCATVH